MNLVGKLKPGMRVVGSDRAEYGTVERYDDTSVYVGGRPIPHDAFERVDRDSLYVGQNGARYFGEPRETRTMTQQDEIRVPLVEERLRVDTRIVELGDVEVRKAIEVEHVSVPIELRRDRVEVHLADVEERPITIAEGMDAFKEEVIRVPVRGEEVVVSKEAVVTGEVAIGRVRASERRTISETVRQQVVEVAAGYDQARPEFREHFDRLQARLREAGGSTFRARNFADAEPNYRAGFEARNDPRHADRSFEDIEPELRERYLATNPEGAASWEARRDEVRTGWEHGRR